MGLIELLIVVILILILIGPIRGRVGPAFPAYDPLMIILIVILVAYLLRGYW